MKVQIMSFCIPCVCLSVCLPACHTIWRK